MRTVDRDLVAEALPSYEIGEELGRGSWGRVIAAYHRQLGRPVAIKQLPRVPSQGEDVRAHFLAEAQVLASLTHPHLVPIYDYVEHEGLCLLVMEQLTGGTLWSRFTDQGLTAQAACAVLLATCAALHHAHEHGVLHRDVKPENVMFSDDGTPKVTDFGIAKVFSGDEALATRAGEVLGTPAYMAPEQAEGGALGPPADVYAAGAMLYELLSGRLPFSEEGGALSIVHRHVHDDPVPLPEAAPTVPRRVADVVMSALARDPDERYQTAEDFAVALGEAATTMWGPGWLERAGLLVAAPGPILASTMRASQPPAGQQGPADETTGVVVRPEAEAHVAGTAADEPDPEDFVSEVLERPPFPRARLITALALLLVTVGVAFAGPAAEQHDERLSPGSLEVAGVDPATGRVPTVDLAEPVPVTVTGAEAGTGELAMALSVAGLPLGPERRAPLEREGEQASALVRLPGARYLAASVVTAEVRLLRGDDETAAYSFGVRNEQHPLLTAPGAAVIALLLFALAYAASFLRHLRRGRRRIRGTLGMTLVGVAGGLAVLGLSWLVEGREPIQLTAVAVAVTGGAAGLSAGLAALRVGRRRRRAPRHG